MLNLSSQTWIKPAAVWLLIALGSSTDGVNRLHVWADEDFYVETKLIPIPPVFVVFTAFTYIIIF